MDRSELAELEQALGRLEKSHRPPPASGQRGLNDALQPLGDAVAAAAHAENAGIAHFSYDELQALAASRAAAPGTWQMPQHLSACPLCLDIFEVLRSPPALPERALVRCVQLDETESRAEPSALPSSNIISYTWRGAAAAVLLVAAGLAIYGYSGSASTAHLRDGRIGLVGGATLARDASLPGKRQLAAFERSKATFEDGSEVVIDPNSRFSLSNRRGSTLVNVDLGSLFFTVAKQREGREFRVHTALGEIIVVGTQFSVSARQDPVTIYRSDKAGAASSSEPAHSLVVEVKVREGRVRVKNAFDEVLATAGQTAVLRMAQPKIDLVGGKE